MMGYQEQIQIVVLDLKGVYGLCIFEHLQRKVEGTGNGTDFTISDVLQMIGNNFFHIQITFSSRIQLTN